MKFKLYRDKTLLGSFRQNVAHQKADEDALQQFALGRTPTYIISGPFPLGEKTRIGKLSLKRRRVYWKFADLIKAKRKNRIQISTLQKKIK